MDQARIPRDAQNQSLIKMGCPELREYVMSGSDRGINFVVANVCKSGYVMGIADCRLLFQVLGKELVLKGRRVLVTNPVYIAYNLEAKGESEVEEELNTYTDLLLLSFFQSNGRCPYSPKEAYLLTEYLAQRADHGLRTHMFWQVSSEEKAHSEAKTWYPDMWVDWVMEDNLSFWVTTRKPTARGRRR